MLVHWPEKRTVFQAMPSGERFYLTVAPNAIVVRGLPAWT
jgi:hypothetical protein